MCNSPGRTRHGNILGGKTSLWSPLFNHSCLHNLGTALFEGYTDCKSAYHVARALEDFTNHPYTSQHDQALQQLKRVHSTEVWYALLQ